STPVRAIGRLERLGLLPFPRSDQRGMARTARQPPPALATTTACPQRTGRTAIPIKGKAERPILLLTPHRRGIGWTSRYSRLQIDLKVGLGQAIDAVCLGRGVVARRRPDQIFPPLRAGQEGATTDVGLIHIPLRGQYVACRLALRNLAQGGCIACH